ncbi:ABC transporter substrate-binding protein [Streptomyces corynorhini]|uniref:ABC transporter substrate-binding protein n=1 Tax=Streptomyces corynorhini TaxID=2282652 RepID=A0A370BJ40_9ACTN|nr:ABC transporter substrate-binding protein [Streptomyces corynorhini]RDG39646.1 ABC transporter substrate-binding protein [Streptomyces corynorhini]
MPPRRAFIRTTAAVLGLVTAFSLTGCGDPADDATDKIDAKGAGGGGSTINLGPEQHRVTTPKVDSIAALVPEAVRERGTLEIVGTTGTAPPLSFYATDDKTVIGVEPDIASLIANVLGLKAHYNTVDWANIFVGLDSGKYDVGLSNITVTEERKDKYDFATYRLDNLAFETKKGAGWKVSEPADVAGRTIAVGSGTNQEKLLVTWSEQNVKKGLKPTDIKYYQKPTDYYLALGSGRIDAYLGPNPTAAYHVASAGQSEIIGTYSGGGADVQGEIAATTKKDHDLIKPVQEALNTVIKNGTYRKVLDRWGLANEAVPSSELNPRGLPRTNQ